MCAAPFSSVVGRTALQAGAGRTSIDEQIRLCEKAFVDTGIPIVASWRDEGFSGDSHFSERPVGREPFAAVKPGEIVVSCRLDRFSRNVMLELAASTNCGNVVWASLSRRIIAGSRPPG